MVGKVFAHVVQQQVGVRADHLVRQQRRGGIVAGAQFGNVAGCATGRCEQALATD